MKASRKWAIWSIPLLVVSLAVIAYADDYDVAHSQQSDPYYNTSDFYTNTKTIRVTNTSGRKLRMTFYCDGTKEASSDFPASVGTTRTVDTVCEFPKVKFQAKIGLSWERASIHYPYEGESLCGQAATSGGDSTCGIYEATIKDNVWWDAITSGDVVGDSPCNGTGTCGVFDSKSCLYVWEGNGHVSFLVRSCPNG